MNKPLLDMLNRAWLELTGCSTGCAMRGERNRGRALDAARKHIARAEGLAGAGQAIYVPIANGGLAQIYRDMKADTATPRITLAVECLVAALRLAETEDLRHEIALALEAAQAALTPAAGPAPLPTALPPFARAGGQSPAGPPPAPVPPPAPSACAATPAPSLYCPSCGSPLEISIRPVR